MKLSVSIMAHKKRAEFIPELVERLGVTEDNVVWDKINNRWDTGRRAWEAIDQSADYGMVIQDDAIVSRDLIPGLEEALNYIPEKAIGCPFIGTRRPMANRVEQAVKEAKRTRTSWVRMPSLNWGIAIILPTKIINEMLPWCDRQAYPNYDRRIGRYCVDVIGYPTYCTWPSLVDHREVPSLVGHGAGRIAHSFLGEDSSALDVDWSQGVVTMGSGFGRTQATRRRTAGTKERNHTKTTQRRPAQTLKAPPQVPFANKGNQ